MKVKDVFWIVVLGAGALYAYDRHAARPAAPDAPASAVARGVVETHPEDRSWIKPRDGAPASASPAAGFTCDGRTHCSQMRSCAEAEFFLRNCPGAQMDGNRDGEPCERQWCN